MKLRDIIKEIKIIGKQLEVTHIVDDGGILYPYVIVQLDSYRLIFSTAFKDNGTIDSYSIEETPYFQLTLDDDEDLNGILKCLYDNNIKVNVSDGFITVPRVYFKFKDNLDEIKLVTNKIRVTGYHIDIHKNKYIGVDMEELGYARAYPETGDMDRSPTFIVGDWNSEFVNNNDVINHLDRKKIKHQVLDFEDEAGLYLVEVNRSYFDFTRLDKRELDEIKLLTSKIRVTGIYEGPYEGLRFGVDGEELGYGDAYPMLKPFQRALSIEEAKFFLVCFTEDTIHNTDIIKFFNRRKIPYEDRNAHDDVGNMTVLVPKAYFDFNNMDKDKLDEIKIIKHILVKYSPNDRTYVVAENIHDVKEFDGYAILCQPNDPDIDDSKQYTTWFFDNDGKLNGTYWGLFREYIKELGIPYQEYYDGIVILKEFVRIIS